MSPPSAKPLPLPIAPVMASDRTSAAIFGVPWRAVREFCKQRGIPIGKIGRRPVVSVAAVVAAIEGGTASWNEDDVIEAAAGGGRK